MINTIILEPEPNALSSLQQHITRYCPFLRVEGSSGCPDTFEKLMAKVSPELVFIADDEVHDDQKGKTGVTIQSPCQVIYLSRKKPLKTSANHPLSFGFIPKPIDAMEFILAINSALNSLIESQQLKRGNQLFQKLEDLRFAGEIIAVPTVEGFQFLPVSTIIRCEGMQKCTKVFVENKQHMVSSYNLGEFARILEPFHFISPHRSHLINARKMTAFHREGTITMQDGSRVPLATRRRDSFLQAIRRIG